MTTLERISKISGYSEADLTGKEYKGSLKNVRMAAIWVMKEEFEVSELAIIFDRKAEGVRRIINIVQDLLDADDRTITRLIDLYYQPSAKQLKNALKNAVDSWDRSMPFDRWIFTSGMEFQAKNKIS